jgi:primosomal protein N' (replication factor Y)
MPLLADVAVPVPLAHAFTYAVPPALAASVKPGARVVCELGRRRLVGVVLRVAEREPPPGLANVKPIAALVDADAVLPAELLDFLVQLGAYYFAPIGEVLRLALPALERDQVRALAAQGELGVGAATRQVGGRKVAFARPTDAIEAPGTLRGQASAILALLRAGGEQPVARLEERFGNARPAVKKLEALGLVAIEMREPPRDPFFANALARDRAPELNAPQAEAAARILGAMDAPMDDARADDDGAASGPKPPRASARAFLLFGVTGSGKTEVYLRAIAGCLERNKGALVMVPEIALTPQLVSRFRARFGDELAVIHSALGEADRHAMWTRLRRGEVKVAIGARSALFAPVPDLGLVIVDEEHDSSFKQEEGVRYHARDMALLRAHRARAVCVLGSATPSLESVELVRKGKLVELGLPDRAVAEATLPAVELVDLRRIGAGPSGNKLISLPLHRAIDKTLTAGEQAILFLNRRGFAPSVLCEACGTIETCQSCSVALTYHRGRSAVYDGAASGPKPRAGGAGGSVRCHYCDFHGPLPEKCSACGAPALALEGLGTERLEATIAESFPAARVARLDRDVADGARAEAIIERMRAGEIDILVGTQMVTKGHDLPKVTLVGVVNADAALSIPDFRAAERGFSLLVQVAGRAGRSDRPGRVLIQTRNPEHAAVQFAAKHDVRGFWERELYDRREVGYPPFSRLALLRLDALDEDAARDAANLLAAAAKTSKEGLARRVDVLGPSAAPIARLRGRYRFRVLLRAAERGPLRATLAIVREAMDRLDRRVRAVIDVDPVAML